MAQRELRMTDTRAGQRPTGAQEDGTTVLSMAVLPHTGIRVPHTEAALVNRYEYNPRPGEYAFTADLHLGGRYVGQVVDDGRSVEPYFTPATHVDGAAAAWRQYWSACKGPGGESLGEGDVLAALDQEELIAAMARDDTAQERVSARRTDDIAPYTTTVAWASIPAATSPAELLAFATNNQQVLLAVDEPGPWQVLTTGGWITLPAAAPGTGRDGRDSAAVRLSAAAFPAKGLPAGAPSAVPPGQTKPGPVRDDSASAAPEQGRGR